MNLKDKVKENTIIAPLIAKNKEDAIHEILNHLQSIDVLSSTIKLFANINEQEKAFTSAAGRGIAYPHSISVEVDELICVLGKSIDGIDFNSPDGHLCHLILLTLSPQNDPSQHRKFITRFRNMVNNPIVRDKLFEAYDYKSVIEIISTWEEDELLKGELE